MTFGALDIEAEDWTEIRDIAAVTTAGDVEHLKSADEGREWVKRQGMRAPVFAHYGGIFDWIHLMPLQSVTLVDGKIQSGMIGGTWCHDDARLMPDGLAKIGRWLGLQKFENRSDRISELTEKEIEEHGERDARITLGAMGAHLEWIQSIPLPSSVEPRWPKTAGANAVFLLEALEPASVSHLRSYSLDPDTWADHYDCHQGPRTEAFYLGRAPGRVYVYDIRSSYARSFLEAPMPVGPWLKTRREVRGVGLGVYYCRVRQNRRRLPVTMIGHALRYEGDGWLTTEEIAAVREAGGRVEVVGGWYSGPVAPFGDKVAAMVYPMKQAGVPWGKSILTALAGKTIQELVRETFFHTPSGYVRDRELLLPHWYHRPLIGCHVYARARLRLWKAQQALLDAGWRLYYSDTDSVHTDCPPDRLPFKLGDDCGDWRLETGPCEALYAGPKFYALRRPKAAGEKANRTWRESGKSLFKVVCTGFDPEAVSWGDVDQVVKGRVIEVARRGGITGFRQVNGGQKPRVKEASRSLRLLAGGKTIGPGGWLAYP